MIQSMTGFGNASFRVQGSNYRIEIRSVNHRHLDVRARFPRALGFLEADVRARIAEHFERGKFDLNVFSAPDSPERLQVGVDLEAVRSYMKAGETLAQEQGVPGQLELSDLIGLPGVATATERAFAPDELQEDWPAALEASLGSLAEMRGREGAALDRDLRARLGTVVEVCDALEERGEEVAKALRERLERRARQIEAESGRLDEARLHQEVVYYADRSDFTEEIVRLRSHVEQFREALDAGGSGVPTGRRLDFLLQEFFREANTVGSKGADAPISHLVVDLKTELDRLREQVQNVE